MHLNSAALSNYLFWNVSLCKSTKGVGFREKIATATAMGLYAAWVQDRARGSAISESPPLGNPLARAGGWTAWGTQRLFANEWIFFWIEGVGGGEFRNILMILVKNGNHGGGKAEKQDETPLWSVKLTNQNNCFKKSKTCTCWNVSVGRFARLCRWAVAAAPAPWHLWPSRGDTEGRAGRCSA